MNKQPQLALALKTLPNEIEIPPRTLSLRGRAPTILIGKLDFEYMQVRGFFGRFAITNRSILRRRNETIATRLAAALLRGDREIILQIANKARTTISPDGLTWRTVRLISAYQTKDGKLCVIEIKLMVEVEE